MIERTHPQPPAMALDTAAAKVIEAHRDWCNYCHGVPEYCRRVPPGGCTVPALENALAALRSAQPVAQEPVAEVVYANWNGINIEPYDTLRNLPKGTKLYLAPTDAAAKGQLEGSIRALESECNQLNEGGMR